MQTNQSQRTLPSESPAYIMRTQSSNKCKYAVAE